MNILFHTDNDDADAVSDPEAGNKTELTNGQVETDSSVPPSSDVRPSVPTSSGAGAMVSQAWGGARPKTTRTRPRNSEASTSSSSSSSARLRNSESVEIRVLPACDQNVSQQSSLEQEFPPSSLHSDRLIPRLESLPHISSSVSRDQEPDTGEDECYVYTYIGGTAYLSADLPNSFFRLDSGSDGESLPGVAGAGQSNLSTGVAALIQDQMVTSPHSPRVRSFSPDQDFIEMDFDPGSETEDGSRDGDSGQGQDGEEDDQEDDDDEADFVEDDARTPSASPPAPPCPVQLVLEGVELPGQVTNNNDLQSKEAAECVECEQQPPVSVPELLPRPPVTASPTHPASAPVLSPSEETVTIMPRSKSLNSSLGECAMSAPERQVRLDNPRLLAIREALLFSGREEPEARTLETGQDSPDLASALQRLTLPSLPLITPVSVLPSQKAMIWTEKEAVRKQATQLPNTSSCGAIALLNVCLALDLEVDPQLVTEAVVTRLRRPDSRLPDYLLSRAEAGCTHEDLLAAVDSHGLRDKLRARFLPLHNRVFSLSSLLVSWISLGLVPVLTLNIQVGPPCPDGQPQDSWHHQMVWGVAGEDVYLANPLDVMHTRVLGPQLDSAGELLIRRTDIVTRANPGLDLMDINRLGPRWRKMNVLGQVVNILREERSMIREQQTAQASAQDPSPGTEVVTLTSHVRIPASYTAGVTLFCPLSNKDGLRYLREAPDLPVRK